MIYLLLAIASSASLSITMRLSEKTVKNNISMLAVNYLMCLFMATLYTGVDNLYVNTEGMTTALLLGILNGFLYLYGFVLFQNNIKKNGVILSSLFMKLGVLIPILMSIFIFKEVPGILQIIGFIIAIIAIIFMNYNKDSKDTFKYSLLLLMVEAGITDGMAKVYEQVGNPMLSEQFLFYTFLFAFVLCLGYTFMKKQTFTLEEVKYGLIIGIPNYFSAKFLLLALGSVSAVIVYPTFSVGTIIVVTILGMVLFKERISIRQKFALLAILIALVLLNL